MGHDHHFLSRLDRVHDQHTELALSLYRDDELIRRILNMAEVPEAADRIAISLDDERRGPFIIVARNGHFVTCLGEGMGVKDAHVITRARLDGMSQYIGVLRERMEQARLLTGGETKLLLASLGQAGEAMSREQFRALLSLTEMLRSCAGTLMEGLDFLYAARSYAKKPVRAGDEEGLRELWRLGWTHAHMHLIVGSEWEPGSPDPLAAFWPDARAQLSWCAVRSGWMPIAIRGVRTAALAGASLLDRLKSAWELGERKSAVLHALFSMIAIAARDRSLSGEVRAILAMAPGVRGPKADAWRLVHEMLSKDILDAVERPDDVQQWVEVGRELVMRTGAHLPLGAAARFFLSSQVPEQLAMASIANSTAPSLDLREGGVRLMIHQSAWAGVAEAADFYADQEYVSSLGPQWIPRKTQDMVDCIHEGMGKRTRPAPTTPKQGPNEPCACGSGKKFKRCCGSVVAA